MIRFIIRTVNDAAACNVGGPVATSYQTVDADVPALEEALKIAPRSYDKKEIIGAEVLKGE